MFRRALCGLSAVAAATALALVPATASASSATVEVPSHLVTFTSRTTATVVVGYTCGDPAAPTTEKLLVAVLQHPVQDDFASVAVNDQAGTKVTCDGTARSTDEVPLAVDPSGRAFENGAARVALLVGEQEDDLVFVDVDVTGVPKPKIALTANAAPEPVRKGSKLKVTGTVTRDGKAVKKARATLLFAKDGGDFVEVKTVRSDKKGRLSTKVKARRSGTWAYAYRGVVSTGDDVLVIPAVKRYKNCDALNQVYPHGVGKKGATDRGGSVDDFTVDGKTYAKNKARDRDKDGIACEQS